MDESVLSLDDDSFVWTMESLDRLDGIPAELMRRNESPQPMRDPESTALNLSWHPVPPTSQTPASPNLDENSWDRDFASESRSWKAKVAYLPILLDTWLTDKIARAGMPIIRVLLLYYKQLFWYYRGLTVWDLRRWSCPGYWPTQRQDSVLCLNYVWIDWLIDCVLYCTSIFLVVWLARNSLFRNPVIGPKFWRVGFAVILYIV